MMVASKEEITYEILLQIDHKLKLLSMLEMLLQSALASLAAFYIAELVGARWTPALAGAGAKISILATGENRWICSKMA